MRSAVVIGDVHGNARASATRRSSATIAATSTRVNAETGAELWSLRVDDHEGAKITGAPVVDPAGGRLYVPVTSWEEIPAPDLTYKCCTFQGSVVALDIKTGKQIWKTYTMPERPRPLRKNSAGTQLYGPAGGGVWNPPTIDLKNKIIYVGTGNTYIVAQNGDSDDAIMAFDLETGRRLWWTHMGPPDPHPGGCGTGEDAADQLPGLHQRSRRRRLGSAGPAHAAGRAADSHRGPGKRPRDGGRSRQPGQGVVGGAGR